MLLSTKRVMNESQLLVKAHNSLCIKVIQKLFILGVFSATSKVVCKYVQHEEARCQEKFRKYNNTGDEKKLKPVAF